MPNWLVSWAANTASTALCADAVDIVGSKMCTFGPRSPPPVTGGVVVPPVVNTAISNSE